MTRIISGSAGGRRIAAPKGIGTRPTTDRVRESLFARLEAMGAVDGARVVDLFAGSGARGLEAMSRGAASAVLVEADPAAAAVARSNVVALGLRPVSVVADRVDRFLSAAAARGEGFDLMLCDPPYVLSDDDLAEVLEAVADVLTPGAVVTVERSARSPRPGWSTILEPLDGRTYGETTVWFAEMPHPTVGAP